MWVHQLSLDQKGFWIRIQYLWIGSQSNTPINPTFSQHGKSNKKKTGIISLRNLQMDIVDQHILYVSKGLTSRPTEVCISVNFLLLPKKDILITTASLSNPINNDKF